MRKPRLRPRRRPVVHLPGHRELRQHLYSFEGRRYVLEHASWSVDGTMQLSLIEEATFRERNEIREQRRWWAGMFRRMYGIQDGPDAA